MSDLWAELDDWADRARDKWKAEKLANVLSREPGTREEKVAFLVANMAKLEAGVARSEAKTAKQQSGEIVSFAIALWRTHCQAPSIAPNASPAERRQAAQKEALRQKYGDPREPSGGGDPPSLRVLPGREHPGRD